MDPWESLTSAGKYEYFKIFLATVTLVAPVRFVILWALLLIGWMLALLVIRFRGSLIETALMHVLRSGARWVMFVCGFYYVFQRGDPDGKTKIFVSTHSSLWDALYLLYKVGVCPAAKRELFDMPIMGAFLRAFRSVPIDRHSSAGRALAVATIAQHVQDPRSPPLVVFPTGCCTNSRQLIAFKRGAFAPRVPVQPVGIVYLGRHYDLKISPNMLWDLYRSTCQGVNWMALTFLPITRNNSESVRNGMAEEFGMQKLDHYRIETEQLRTRCRRILFNPERFIGKYIDYSLAHKVVERVESMVDADGCIGPVGSATEWSELLSLVKSTTCSQGLVNHDVWTEQGWIGLLTGGRARQTPSFHPSFENKIEVTELIAYMSSNPNCPLIAQLFPV